MIKSFYNKSLDGILIDGEIDRQIIANLTLKFLGIL